MNYLNFNKLASLKTEDFYRQKPYPWINMPKLITDQGFQILLDNMPDIALFEKKFGYERRAGQAPHDRYSLEYVPGLVVPAPWVEFIDELRSDAYRNEISRLFNARKPEFRFHWHYTPTGCAVSPHCDARREHGSHLFYFNSEDDWDPAWGGDTLMLDDGGRLSNDSAPALEEFDQIYRSTSLGNYSAIIKRNDHGWHAVEAIDCPEDRLRRVFIIVVNPGSLFWKVRDRIVGKQIQRL